MQYRTHRRTQESSTGRNSWKKIEIHALNSCRNRFAVLETWHRNLEVVDNYTPVNESKLISCAHLSFLFLTACFPVLEMNPCSKKCGVKWLNSLLITVSLMLWLKCSLRASVERWWDPRWGNDHHPSKMFSAAALGREYTGAICSSWFCFKGL